MEKVRQRKVVETAESWAQKKVEAMQQERRDVAEVARAWKVAEKDQQKAATVKALIEVSRRTGLTSKCGPKAASSRIV